MNGQEEDSRTFSSWKKNNTTDVMTSPDLSDRDPDAFHSVPESVQQFLSYFRQKFREGNVSEVHTLYETTFNRYSERYFKTTSWPSPEIVAKYVDDGKYHIFILIESPFLTSEWFGLDEVFLLFYKELYYRHIYSRLVPTLAQRLEAWENYCELFNFILSECYEVFQVLSDKLYR